MKNRKVILLGFLVLFLAGAAARIGFWVLSRSSVHGSREEAAAVDLTAVKPPMITLSGPSKIKASKSQLVPIEVEIRLSGFDEYRREFRSLQVVSAVAKGKMQFNSRKLSRIDENGSDEGVFRLKGELQVPAAPGLYKLVVHSILNYHSSGEHDRKSSLFEQVVGEIEVAR